MLILKTPGQFRRVGNSIYCTASLGVWVCVEESTDYASKIVFLSSRYFSVSSPFFILVWQCLNI